MLLLQNPVPFRGKWSKGLEFKSPFKNKERNLSHWLRWACADKRAYEPALARQSLRCTLTHYGELAELAEASGKETDNWSHLMAAHARSHIGSQSTRTYGPLFHEMVQINVHGNELYRKKTCFMLYANNKGTDQPAHPSSLISAFVVHCLDRSCAQNFKTVDSLCSWTGRCESCLVAKPRRKICFVMWLKFTKYRIASRWIAAQCKGMRMVGRRYYQSVGFVRHVDSFLHCVCESNSFVQRSNRLRGVVPVVNTSTW